MFCTCSSVCSNSLSRLLRLPANWISFFAGTVAMLPMLSRSSSSLFSVACISASMCCWVWLSFWSFFNYAAFCSGAMVCCSCPVLSSKLTMLSLAMLSLLIMLPLLLLSLLQCLLLVCFLVRLFCFVAVISRMRLRCVVVKRLMDLFCPDGLMS